MVSRPSRIVKKKPQKQPPYGHLLDQVCRMRNLANNKRGQYRKIAADLNKVLGDLDPPLPSVAELEAAKARFFAMPEPERRDIFNGWSTMTTALPPQDLKPDFFQRLLSVAPMPETRSAITHVDWRARETTYPVEVLIMEGASFVEALAGIEIARDLILHQWAKLISESGVEVCHV